MRTETVEFDHTPFTLASYVSQRDGAYVLEIDTAVCDVDHQVRVLFNDGVLFEGNAERDEPAAVVLARVLEALVGVEDTTTVRELAARLQTLAGGASC